MCPLFVGNLRLIHALDRQVALELIEEANDNGARYEKACEILGICVRTYQSWRRDEYSLIDQRKGSHLTKPSHSLSELERQQIIEVCCRKEYSSLPPSKIVPLLSDKGIYIASESSFYRVLREKAMTKQRGRAKKKSKPKCTRTHS